MGRQHRVNLNSHTLASLYTCGIDNKATTVLNAVADKFQRQGTRRVLYCGCEYYFITDTCKRRAVDGSNKKGVNIRVPIIDKQCIGEGNVCIVDL